MILEKYEEIMDKLEVTGEMKARILGNLQEIFSKNQMFSQNMMVFSKENARRH